MSADRAAGARLSDRQRLNWLRLIRTQNVGPASFRDLINRFGSAQNALEALPELVAAGGGRSLQIPSMADCEAEMQRASRCGARFVAIGEPDYPPLMRRMEHPPPLLAIKGDASVFALPGVAVVDARNASLAGIRFARGLAADLGREGYGVVSGLARGIDAAAHDGALATGTVAVLAGGLDRPYPPENIALLEAIVAGAGAAVSEMPFGWEPRAPDFPRRNRLIAGLAYGLVVVEAAKRSGSLISARLAGEMGRLVFAVPGSPLDPRAGGTNGLIKDGAIVTTEAADVTAQIAPLIGRSPPPVGGMDEWTDLASAPPPGRSDRELIMEALGPVPTGVDDLIRHTGLHPAQVVVILLELDLAGRLERHPGNAVSLIPG